MWQRSVNPWPYRYRVIAERYSVEFTGGSVTIYKTADGSLLKRHKDLNYVYTGDIHPQETECFGLENGKHFYVYSLETLERIKRVTLPRCYEAIDVEGHYSKDGRYIYIPVHKWVATDPKKGYYEYGYYDRRVLRYETEQYTLVDNRKAGTWSLYRGRLGELWKINPDETNQTEDPDTEAILQLAFGE